MTKFNVGDKVRVINQSHGWDTVSKGDEGEIVSINHDGTYEVSIPTFQFDSWTGEEYCFELISPKPTKNQRITALENEVAELKLIVHELRGKKSIEPSTTNTVEDIIEFEGKQYRKVDREAREGDVVMQDVEHSAWMEKGHFYRVLSEGKVFLGKGVEALLYTGWNGRTVDTVNVYELIKSKPLTSNQQRAAIIEKAKQFVEENQDDYFHVEVDDEKRTVFTWKLITEGKIYKAITCLASCHSDDVFNEHIGKAIALGRALGLDVSEFEQAVQPTIAVGQIVHSGMTIYEVLTLENIFGNVKYKDDNGYWQDAEGGYLQKETWYKIINDTNAIYEEGQ